MHKPLSLSQFFSWFDLKILLLPSNPLLPFQVSDLILKYLESKCTRLGNQIMVMVHPALLYQQLWNILDNSCNSFSRSYHIQNILVYTTFSLKMGHVRILNN